jgi:hypothetical protein
VPTMSPPATVARPRASLQGIGRRAVLRSAFAGMAGGLVATGMSSCATGEANTTMPSRDTTQSPSAQGTPSPRGNSARVLLAYFSRAGENYYYGGRTDLDVGNTEVLARMISALIACDVHRIEAADPYPDGYGAAVERNVREQDAGTRLLRSPSRPSA